MSAFVALSLQFGLPSDRWGVQWWTMMLALLVPICMLAIADYRIRLRR